MWAQAPQDSVSVKIQADTLALSDQVIAYARTFLGTPYKLGASGPSRFDCSSYTRYVFKHFGFDITAYSAIQFREGREVPSYKDLQKGDLVFFGFTFIHASVSNGVVEQSFNHPYFMMRYMGARRILPDE